VPVIIKRSQGRGNRGLLFVERDRFGTRSRGEPRRKGREEEGRGGVEPKEEEGIGNSATGSGNKNGNGNRGGRGYNLGRPFAII